MLSKRGFIDIDIFFQKIGRVFVVEGGIGAKDYFASRSRAMESFSPSQKHGENASGSGKHEQRYKSPEPPVGSA